MILACSNNQESNPSSTTTIDGTKIIAEAEIDYDGNGELEKLYVRMVTGELKEETEPGPNMGKNWEGKFQLELVAHDGSLLHTLDLNPTFGGGSLLFSQDRDFNISFQDYNNDGYLEFSIGQYFTSNGFVYNLYSLLPDGIHVIHQNLFSTNRDYSILFEKAGNTSFKNRYYDMEKGKDVDTLFTWQGNRFVRTECEGCGITAGTGIEAAVEKLKLSVKKTDDGFYVSGSEEEGLHVSQTLVSPSIEGTSYAVHIIRMYTEEPQVNLRRDAVVVDPKTAEFRSFPLYNAQVEDSYGADSIAIAYGFIDDQHLLYVSIVNDVNRTDGYYYRVEKLNIMSGEATVLIPEVPNVSTTDYFAPGWLNSSKDTLVLNSYESGQLWSIDLVKGEISLAEDRFGHPWPFFAIANSPDGERFWYSDYSNKEYRLHDKTGRSLSKISFGEGYEQYPSFQWSPDSQYAAKQDTLEKNDDHIINDEGEAYIIAPKRIRFFGRDGELIRTIQGGLSKDKKSSRYIEIAGWLDNEDAVVLLHEYDLDRSTSSHPTKINASYRLLDIKSGKIQSLDIATASMELTNTIPARISQTNSGTDRILYTMDKKRNLLIILSENGYWLPEQNEKHYNWVTTMSGMEGTVFHHFNPKTGQISDKILYEGAENIHMIGTEWSVWSDMQYFQLK